MALEWHCKFKPNWSQNHGQRVLTRLESDVFLWIGKRPIKEITAPELLAVLRRIESRTALETTHKVTQYCGQIFRYAVAAGRAERDPSRDLRGALPPVKTKHFARSTYPK